MEEDYDYYDDEEYDFAIKTTSPNNGLEHRGLPQSVTIELKEIKEEDEEEIIDVDVKEEEIEIDEQDYTEKDKPCIDFDLHCDHSGIDIRLISLPIVYTTRLDDMRIFKEKYQNRIKNDVLSKVLQESIPKYDNRKPITKPYSARSFATLKQKINKFNEQVKSSSDRIQGYTGYSLDNVLHEAKLSMNAYLRNQELMKMCKPCSVVLVKIDEYSKAQATKYERRNQTIKLTHIPVIACLIFYDTSNKQVDAYCIKDGQIKENFTIKDIENLDESPQISEYKYQGIRPRVMSCCCWQKRQSYINGLDFKAFKSSVKDFMRKPHYCEFDRCICCCKPRTDKDVVEDIAREDAEIEGLDNEISTLCAIKRHPVEYGYKSDWLDKLLKETKQGDDFVYRALNYTRLPKMLSGSKSKNVSKRFETKSIMQIDSLNQFELIELQEKGDIVAYKKENYNPMIGLSRKEGIEKLNSCCWFKREQIIKTPRLKSAISPKQQTFLKLPHKCLPQNCTCCCNPCKKTKSNLKNIALPKKGTLSYGTTSVSTTQTTKSIFDPPSSQVTVGPIIDLTLSKSTLPSEDAPVLTKPVLESKELTASNTTGVSKKQQFEQNKKNQYVTVPTADNNVQEIAVDSLITSILDRFKDVRLTINEDGKVAAALNAPVNTLTTAELKVLANILAHAQAQVTSLGLQPGSLLNAKDIQRSAVESEVIPSKPVENTHSSVETDSFNLPSNTANLNSPSPINQNQTNLYRYTYLNNSLSNKSLTQQTTDSKNKNVTNLYKSFSNMSQHNSSSLLQSYTSFIRAQNKASSVSDDQNKSEKDINLDEEFAPKIANVFSLKGADNDTSVSESVKSTALNAWSETERSESCAKRKAETNDPKPQPASKIRVVDPAKLGITQPTSTNSDFIGTQLIQPTTVVGTSTNLNFIGTQLQTIQPTTVQPGLLISPSRSVSTNEIFQSLPGLNNAQLVRMPSTVPNNSNNIIVINPLRTVGSAGTPFSNVFVSPTNAYNPQLILPSTQTMTPLNMNALVQNIASDRDGKKPSTVFTISNLDKATVAEPRLLNVKMPTNRHKNQPGIVRKK